MKVAQIWRHPIKSHGREALDQVTLTAGQTMPFDRAWAIAHEAARIDQNDPTWAPCANFSRGSKTPALMAIEARLNETTNEITLTHPDRPSLTINPDAAAGADALIQWVKPLCAPDRAQPDAVYKVPGRGMTDSDFASVSLNSLSSLADLSEKARHPVSALRFRGNIWIEGAEPWAELDWVGQDIQIGDARLKVVERTERCLATTANPETGLRDLDLLKILNDTWGHQDFGVRAQVITSGSLKIGDQVSV